MASGTNQPEQVIYDRTQPTPISKIIEKKSEGSALNQEEIDSFVRGVVKGTATEAQIGAMLMAMFNHRLDYGETYNLTKAMIQYGDKKRWPKEWRGSIVAKHSTGGVGDKVSLVLAPALAACGVRVPMISGRGLAHTGGTLDKLESITGLSTAVDDMEKVLTDVGCCIVGQGGLVPADEKLYDRRNATSTINEDGLITASIISKKVAESPDALVLDVKVGTGAFCRTVERATKLAQRMVIVGNALGVPTVAYLTDMNIPLGKMIGNSLEVEESIQCLHGKGPADLTDLVIELGSQLLYKVGKATRLCDCKQLLRDTLKPDGTAISKFKEMIKAQGVGEVAANNLCRAGANVSDILPIARHSTELKTNKSGFVHNIEALECGKVSQELGGNRIDASDVISYGVGLRLSTHIGEYIEKGSTWVTVFHDEETLSDGYRTRLQHAIHIDEGQVTASPRVIDIIE